MTLERLARWPSSTRQFALCVCHPQGHAPSTQTRQMVHQTRSTADEGGGPIQRRPNPGPRPGPSPTAKAWTMAPAAVVQLQHRLSAAPRSHTPQPWTCSTSCVAWATSRGRRRRCSTDVPWGRTSSRWRASSSSASTSSCPPSPSLPARLSRTTCATRRRSSTTPTPAA